MTVLRLSAVSALHHWVCAGNNSYVPTINYHKVNEANKIAKHTI